MRLWVKALLVLLVLLLLAGALSVPTLTQYAAYQQADAVPRLRQFIGKRVWLPPQSGVILGETHTSGPYTGRLLSVKYRFNDKPGFIDCAVHLERVQDGDTGVFTGLSLEAVKQVRLLEEP